MTRRPARANAERATREPRDEAEALAALIREVFQTEADVYGDIPPLHETAADLEATFDAGDVTLVAELDGTVVGTVRGETMTDNTLVVRRLAVLPLARGRGIGRALLVGPRGALPVREPLRAVHRRPEQGRDGLYESLGYERIGSREVAPGVELVTLEKLAW